MSGTTPWLSTFLFLLFIAFETTVAQALHENVPSAAVKTPSRRQVSNPATSNFIRRAIHSSVIIGNHLFIDGGEISQFVDGYEDPQWSRTNNYTLSIDMSSDWTNSSVEIKTVPKGGSPIFNWPGIWPESDNSFLMWGGYVSTKAANKTTPEKAVWRFTADSTGTGTWAKVDPGDPRSFTELTRPANGVCGTSNNTGYYIGGFHSNASDPDVSSSKTVPLTGMVRYNWETQTWSNVSSIPYTSPFGQLALTNLTIYDQATGEWHAQQTTGEAPSKRNLFCAVGAPGSGGTFEIFVYGGWDGSLGLAYDDIYILSLPGFRWFKISSSTTGTPRSFHTCNRVASQMVVVGGVDYSLGVPEDWQDPDPWDNGLGVFDLNNLVWQSSYNASAAAYDTPQVVKEWYNIGGLNNVSWDSTAMRDLFLSATTDSSGNTNSTQESSQGSSNHAGAIAGGVVGGVAGVALLAGVAFFLIRRRRASRKPSDPIQEYQMAEKDAQNEYNELPVRQPEIGSENLVHELPEDTANMSRSKKPGPR
ncbi:hypothetical protein IWZ03DRAFT_413746 [Phyllosticta citriasiana]|uniref:Kelch repeat protein n=1 Tax=Phyllosticta citriasiana TaxID=595635 RepID=A0ABR1KRL0_9PEZI